MKDKTQISPEQLLSKKEAREQVNQKMALALAEYKGVLSEKKFRVKLKKASKLFATGIAKAMNKRNGRPAPKSPGLAR